MISLDDNTVLFSCPNCNKAYALELPTDERQGARVGLAHCKRCGRDQWLVLAVDGTVTQLTEKEFNTLYRYDKTKESVYSVAGVEA